MNVPNLENSMENCVHKWYRQFRIIEKFDFVRSLKSGKLNRKLSTIDVQII